MDLLQSVKDRLVTLGPAHPLVRLALGLHGRFHGSRVRFDGERILIGRKGRTMILGRSNYPFVPYMVKLFDYYFDTIEATPADGEMVLDFSGPKMHRYRASGVELIFPNIPEDDTMEAYTYKFQPRAGMTVLDAGANAGLTTYFLSQMVGRSGTVYAFEPDETNRRFLEQNIERHGLENVSVLGEALGRHTGRAAFNMDGTMAAGLVDCLIYPDTGRRREVPTITIEDFCARIGRVPDFIKMDIEGAEVSVIESSLDFLRKHPIHFAIDSLHKGEDGRFTSHELERLFRSINYEADSSDRFGFLFTWATPRVGDA